MNRLKGIVYDLIGWLARFGWRNQSAVQKVLIIRVDEIGDYILWRPFLKCYPQIPGLGNAALFFCGNQSWKSLFTQLDAKYVNEAFWLDKLRFKKDMAYRFRFLRMVYKAGFSSVINPTYSRDKRYDDSIVRAAKAKINWGMEANQESVQPYETGYDKDLYPSVFRTPEKPIFEFFRNRLFTEFLLQRSIPEISIRIDDAYLPPLTEKLPGNYFVVFPGSRSASRIWPVDNFIRVSNYLYETFGWTAVLAGTKNDAVYIRDFLASYKYPVINLQGKTTLPDMLSLLKNATCLLSVDTGSVHLAAAVGCTVFGIFNGSQFKRFAPYPKELTTHFYAIYPDEVEKELQDPELVKEKYEFVVKIPYSLVRPEKVILAIHEHFM
jgi:ADP-heptose:LPS heptosyltransferase